MKPKDERKLTALLAKYGSLEVIAHIILMERTVTAMHVEEQVMKKVARLKKLKQQYIYLKDKPGKRGERR